MPDGGFPAHRWLNRSNSVSACACKGTPSNGHDVDPSVQPYLDCDELLRRGKDLRDCRQALQEQRDELTDQRKEPARHNTLRERIPGFSATVGADINYLDFEQRQELLRPVVEQVPVRGWQVEIRLRIALDEPPTPESRGLSGKDRLRSLHGTERPMPGKHIHKRHNEILMASRGKNRSVRKSSEEKGISEGSAGRRIERGEWVLRSAHPERRWPARPGALAWAREPEMESLLCRDPGHRAYRHWELAHEKGGGIERSSQADD